MFWPSSDEGVAVYSGAMTHAVYHVAMFGLKPNVPDLTSNDEGGSQTENCKAVPEVTSFFVKKAAAMADSFSQSRDVLRTIWDRPIIRRSALWKHHGNVG